MENEARSRLYDLIELDRDMIESYQRAVKKLSDFTLRSELHVFIDDYDRQVNELTPALQAMGVTPTRHASLRTILETGKIALAGLLGDRAILSTMKSNETRAVKEYERACEQLARRRPLIGTLTRGLGVARNHRRFIEDQL